MISIVLSVIAGIVLVGFHRARLKEVEENVRREMTARLRTEQRAYQRLTNALTDEIIELYMERDAANEKAEASYERGRHDQQKESSETANWIKAYEKQQIHLALRGGR